ncbi:MAG: oxidoreductase [Rhodospirillaceae bacterium TMED8]|nr:oxidoreductase [Magnetovibrio sp.]OUT52349.1 MAG: oxidoreductase [Rhodospirillaceae bacterium TMED8]
MGVEEFTCLFLEEDENRKVSNSIQRLTNDQLPEGDVTVAVQYSTLNYKDGMIIKGLGRLVREYPHVPGIDFCGIVEESSSPDYSPGDKVILTGWRVGEVHWGGFSQRARVKSEWLVPAPDGISLLQTMAIGTAGVTAMLAIMTLEAHGLSRGSEKEVLVTGAGGGVGSIAVSILANLGYKVAAGTGRVEIHDYLTDLGAATLVSREELAEVPKGPLARERWAGVIDNVGGSMLGTVLSSVAYWGTVASVGNAGGVEFSSNVLPFLLRGINLCGIDSNTCPKSRRIEAWNRLAVELPFNKLEAITTIAPLSDLPGLAGKILEGQVRGRTVIDVNA